MAGLASHGCGPNGSTTSLVLACRMLRAVQNPCRHIIVLPSTGLPPPWQFVCAESNTRIQSLTSRCAQLSPRWVCCVSNVISYAQRATVRIHLHSQISCSLDGSVTSLACHTRRAIHSNAHPCAARWLSCSPRRVSHVSGMSCAQSYSFQCSLVRGTVALVQPSTGLPRLWHVACAELFFQERTRGKARWPAVLGSASQGTELAVPHKLTRGKARWLAVLGSASHRHCVIASMRVAVLAETPRTVAAFLCTLAAPQVGGSLQHIHITLAS